MSLSPLIMKIQGTAGCLVLPPDGLPQVKRDDLGLPEDVREFYQLCGGLRLFEDSGLSVSIVPPGLVVPADPVILLGATVEELTLYHEDEISWSWYIIADAGNGEYVTIDLHPRRLGRCYDSSWYLHPGNSKVIALSFTEFLERLFEGLGATWYWKEPGFEAYGDAYDA